MPWTPCRTATPSKSSWSRRPARKTEHVWPVADGRSRSWRSIDANRSLSFGQGRRALPGPFGRDRGGSRPGRSRLVLRRSRGADLGDVAAVGGPVENGKPGLVNWAVFFCEYAAVHGPVPEGECSDLPGNDLEYRRPLLLRHPEYLRQGSGNPGIHDGSAADGDPAGVGERGGGPARQTVPARALLPPAIPLRESSPACDGGSVLAETARSTGRLACPTRAAPARMTRTVLAKRRHFGRFCSASFDRVVPHGRGVRGDAGISVGSGRSLERVE